MQRRAYPIANCCTRAGQSSRVAAAASPLLDAMTTAASCSGKITIRTKNQPPLPAPKWVTPQRWSRPIPHPSASGDGAYSNAGYAVQLSCPFCSATAANVAVHDFVQEAM